MSLSEARELIKHDDPRMAAFIDGDWELHELPTGHWPMFSLPDALVELLAQIAGGDPGANLANTSVDVSG
jgi:hypothetical protein